MPNGELPEEYQQHLKQTVNWLERLGDSLSGVDERVDYSVKQLSHVTELTEALTTGVGELSKLSDRIISQLEQAGLVVPGHTEQVNFPYNLQPLEGVELQVLSPLAGRITVICFHFPDGCNGLIELAFGRGKSQVCPNEGFLALDGATPVLPISENVAEGDKLWCIMQNADLVNNYHVSVSVIIVGE